MMKNDVRYYLHGKFLKNIDDNLKLEAVVGSVMDVVGLLKKIKTFPSNSIISLVIFVIIMWNEMALEAFRNST